MVDVGGNTTISSVVKAQCSSGAHHWLIRTPDGPTSEGVCRWCGARRDFANQVSWRYGSQGQRVRKPSTDEPS